MSKRLEGIFRNIFDNFNIFGNWLRCWGTWGTVGLWWRTHARTCARTFSTQMEKIYAVSSQPDPQCAHYLTHSPTNRPNSPYWARSTALRLNPAISRKPRWAQLIELGGPAGGLLPARHFLSFVHLALRLWSQISDSLRAAQTEVCLDSYWWEV